VWGNQDTLAKLTVIGSLYIAFGTASGFFQTALPTIFRQRGVSLEAIGLFALVYLPFGLSFVWAPLVDRYYFPRIGRRRSWMLGCQLLSGAALLAAATTPPEVSLTATLSAFGLLCFAAATIDVAIDGYAVENLHTHERGWGNGVQVGGMCVGFACGGGGLLILYDSLGWRSCLVLMAVATGVSLLPMCLRAEPSPPLEAVRDGRTTASVFLFFRRRGAWRIVLFMLVLYGPMSLGLGMVRPFLVDLGLSLTEIGWMMGTGGSLAGLAGATLAGSLINPLGRRGAIVCSGLLQAALIGGMSLVATAPTQNTFVITCLVCAEMFIYSTFFVAVATVAMDWSSLAQAGTDYTIMQCCMFLTGIVATAAGGFLASAVGWAAYFTFSAVLAAGGIGVAVGLFPRINAEISAITSS
jgi:PAT family beta-lactamase induction signal transducer AmpG